MCVELLQRKPTWVNHTNLENILGIRSVFSISSHAELNVFYIVNVHIFPLSHQEHNFYFYQFFLLIPIVT